MNAFISGQARTAFVMEGDSSYSIHVDLPSETIARSNTEAPLLFDGVNDIISVKDITHDDVLKKLEIESRNDRSFHLLLILLDKSEDIDTKKMAAECLSEYFNSEVVSFLGKYMYAAPLPDTSDAFTAKDLAKAYDNSYLHEFLDQLIDDQDDISLRCAAWDGLSIDLFGSESEKAAFKLDAIKAGAFYLFTKNINKPDFALFTLLVSPEFKGKSAARKVLQAWAKPFKETVTGTDFQDWLEVASEEDKYVDSLESGTHKPGAYVFANVKKQKAAIRDTLLSGKRREAFRYIRELIQSQYSNSKPEHISKTLCDLAQFSKKIGDNVLQLNLSLWARKENPSDSWAAAQTGDAYIQLGDYVKAISAYQESGVLGDIKIAMCGRASALRGLGQLPEAFEIYQECESQFPNDSVPSCGKSEVLADMGRLSEALSLYDENVGKYPNEVAVFAGRAALLKEMNRLEDSLYAYDEALRLFPDDLVVMNGRSETLRELGQYEEALYGFEIASKKYPHDSRSKIGSASVLADLERFDEARELLSKLKKKLVKNPYVHNAYADLYRKEGKIDDAIEAYELNMRKFIRNNASKNGLASALVVKGEFEYAQKLLIQELPASRSEWINYHIKGMVELKLGNIVKAKEIFEWGIQENPWPADRAYFTTALAMVQIKESRYEDAIKLLNYNVMPKLTPLVHVLEVHTYSILGDVEKALIAFDNIKDTCPKYLTKTRDLLAENFIGKEAANDTSIIDDLLEMENNALLLVA